MTTWQTWLMWGFIGVVGVLVGVVVGGRREFNLTPPTPTDRGWYNRLTGVWGRVQAWPGWHKTTRPLIAFGLAGILAFGILQVSRMLAGVDEVEADEDRGW